MAEMSYVYAGTVRSAAGGSGGIFRQTAGDQRWEALTNGLLDETQVHAITVHPANPEVVFIGMTKVTLPPGAPLLEARIRREETDECARDGSARSRSSLC